MTPDSGNGGQRPPIPEDLSRRQAPEVVISLPNYLGENLRRRELTRAAPGGTVPIVGQPSSYSLSAADLARHIRQLRRHGWQHWEIRARFEFEPSDAA